ncbi:hypothetical protein [uncultured Tateyamaria sp.]|uniref:hypothetical protein n=1 Tax=uncultured Tateyamaria sp. TaxID=455651 RepID=UPI0026358127|nr:hypothetical protein [uncultured Tateyamaria sp.]
MAKENPHQHIVDQWIETAGPWADQPIGSFSDRDWLPYVTRVTRHRDVLVDFRKVRGTTHPAYGGGMTYREFLSYGEKMYRMRRNLDESPEYFADPVGWQKKNNSYAGWSLYKINGSLFGDEGPHRTVIARMIAEEGGITALRVPLVRELEIDSDALEAEGELRSLLRDDQWLSVENEPYFRSDDVELNEVFFLVTGYGLGTGHYGKPQEILEIVRRANSSHIDTLISGLRAAAVYLGGQFPKGNQHS